MYSLRIDRIALGEKDKCIGGVIQSRIYKVFREFRTHLQNLQGGDFLLLGRCWANREESRDYDESGFCHRWVRPTAARRATEDDESSF